MYPGCTCPHVMNRLLLIFVATVVVQSATAQVTIAPEAGFLLTDIRSKIGGDRFKDFELKPGFRAGANLDMAIADHLHLHAGLFYSSAGAVVPDYGTTSERAVLARDYLQLPVYLNYHSGAAGDNHFFAGAGPYLAYALGAYNKLGDTKSKGSIGNTAGEDLLKPLDAGININAGYQLAMGLYFRAHYSLGLMNTYPGGSSNTFMKNSAFGISLGYAFQL